MALMLILTMVDLVFLKLIAIRFLRYHNHQQQANSTNSQDIKKVILKSKYSVKDSRDLLDYMVNQKLTEWQIYHIDTSSDNYITENDMKDCIEYIIKKIIEELTDTSLLVLSVGYPMETEEQQIESIKNRAKLAVLNYAIQQNTPKESGEEVLKNINSF